MSPCLCIACACSSCAQEAEERGCPRFSNRSSQDGLSENVIKPLVFTRASFILQISSRKGCNCSLGHIFAVAWVRVRAAFEVGSLLCVIRETTQLSGSSAA